jgi:hypothetical protein
MAANYSRSHDYRQVKYIDAPGRPGVLALGAFSFPGGQSMAAMNCYLYGDQVAGTVARQTTLWQTWIGERFPAPSETSPRES